MNPSMMLYLAYALSESNYREPEPIDMEALQKEYDLIKQKKSKLSANQRRAIVRLYESKIKEQP